MSTTGQTASASLGGADVNLAVDGVLGLSVDGVLSLAVTSNAELAGKSAAQTV